MTKELEHIIFKFLLKEGLNFSEKQQLNDWLSADKAHHKTLSHLALILTADFDEMKSKSKEETWDWLMKKKGSKSENPRKFISMSFGQFVRVAVVLLVIATAGIFSFHLSNAPDPVVYTSHLIEKVALPGQKITTVLPDGTKVKLNSGSQLIVPEKFIGDTRQVSLIGEAFFEVAHDESKPFIIKTQQMDVSVLGTSFNVRSYPSDDLIEVAVATGKVAFSRESDESRGSGSNTYLVKGEKGSYSKSKNLITKHEFDESVEFGWKDNLMVFDQDHLSEIVKELGNWYGVSVKFDKEYILPSTTFSGSYDDPTLNSVVKGLSYVYGFEYEIRKDSVIIKKAKQ